jgi:hypothetical protein
MKSRLLILSLATSVFVLNSSVLAITIPTLPTLPTTDDPYEYTKEIYRIAKKVREEEKKDQKSDGLNWFDKAVTDIDNISKMVEGVTDLYSSIAAIFGGSATSTYDKVHDALAKGTFLGETYDSIFNKKPETRTFSDGTQVTITDQGEKATAALALSESTAIATEKINSVAATQSAVSIANKYSNDPKPGDLYKWVMDESNGTAVKLDDALDTAVSTRAAVQALGNGFANYMRQSARGDAAVIDRLNGIMQQAVESNKQLQAIVNQEFKKRSDAQQQAEIVRAEQKAKGEAEVNTMSKNASASQSFIALGIDSSKISFNK